jgi:hypothetical protein
VRAGVDSAWEQKKPEARKMLENAARAEHSPARQVHAVLGNHELTKSLGIKKAQSHTD